MNTGRERGIKFAQLSVKTRDGRSAVRRESAALGRTRGEQSTVGVEKKKRGRIRNRFAAKRRGRGVKGLRQKKAVQKVYGLANDDQDMDERIDASARQAFIRGGKRGGATAAKGIYKAGSFAASRSVRAAGKASGAMERAAGRTSKNAGRRVLTKTARKAGESAARAARAAKAASTAISHAVAAIGAAISSLSVPLVVAVTVVAAIVGLMAAMFSWLPGAANNQDAETADAGDFPIKDDYPYKGRYNDGTSPLGYEYGNCTDFAAWRVNRDLGVTAAPWKYKWAQLTPHGGNGGQWGQSGNLPGWNVTTSPAPGDIISIPAGVAVLGSTGGPYGHVGYIAQVSGDKVTIENYGGGKYFLTSPTTSQLAAYISAGQAVVKHNPASRGGTQGGGNGDAKAYAKSTLNNEIQYQCLVQLWDHESGWRVNAENPSSRAYGIPQALPGNKMASAGSDWKTNGITQVKWGLGYIAGRADYGNPCGAWTKWQSRSPHWY